MCREHSGGGTTYSDDKTNESNQPTKLKREPNNYIQGEPEVWRYRHSIGEGNHGAAAKEKIVPGRDCRPAPCPRRRETPREPACSC